MESGLDIFALQKMFEDTHQEEEEQQEVYDQVIEPKETDTFWDEDEVTPIGFYKDDSDERPEPEYTVHYKQNVGTEDVYLGLSMKDPSLSSADSVIINVKLVDTKPDDVDLNIQKGYLDLRTPRYRLTLKLDRPTKDNMAVAKWKAGQDVLEIEIPLIQGEIKIV